MDGDRMAALAEDERRLISANLDRAYYFRHNSDMAAESVDPVAHYLLFWRERRNPSSLFDTGFYLDNNPDVAAAGINPFYHYLTAGKAEGRRATPDPWRLRLDTSRPIEARIKDWDAGREFFAPLAAEAIAARLESVAATSLGLMVTISHEDFGTTGGVQGIVHAEHEAFKYAGWNCLHISPINRMHALLQYDRDEEVPVIVHLDGDLVGVCLLRDVAAAIGTLRPRLRIECVIHHLFGHSPERLEQFIAGLGVAAPIFWVHDFSTLCASFALLRNDIKFCHAPPPDSSACAICSYGSIRHAYLDRVAKLFERLNPVVLAPSRFALDFWKRHSNFRHRASAVVAPAKFVASPLSPETGPAQRRTLRVAHIGQPSFTKGWPMFVDLAERADPGRYEFYQIGGASDMHAAGIRHVDALVTADNPRAMINAVASFRIDIVVNWSQCSETFSFTTIEALAAGAFVVARRGAGNVWPLIEATAPRQGMAVEDEDELLALFAGDDLSRRLEESERKYGMLLRLGATADWLFAGGAIP